VVVVVFLDLEHPCRAIAIASQGGEAGQRVNDWLGSAGRRICLLDRGTGGSRRSSVSGLRGLLERVLNVTVGSSLLEALLPGDLGGRRLLLILHILVIGTTVRWTSCVILLLFFALSLCWAGHL